MLTLNRPHRQALATLALLAFTVAPSVYVGWMAWQINQPGHLREIEAEIGRQLGLRATLEGVRHPRPGEDVLTGVVLSLEEQRGREARVVAQARSVRVHRADGGVSLMVEGLTLHGESPGQAASQATALLGRAGGSANASVRSVSLSAPTCEVDLGDGGPQFRLKDVAGTLRADRDQPTVSVSYLVPMAELNTRCELTLRRDRAAAPVRTTLAFRTLEGPPLPARALDPYFDTEAWLGRSARLDGTLTLHQAGSAGWEAEFAGSLLDVDLAALVGRRFPDHRLSGLARVEIDLARWADRPGGQGFGWVEARGRLRTGPGAIGQKLLQALRAEMSFRVPRSPEIRTIDLPFQNLGLAFEMTDDGELRLDGGLGEEYPPGAVLVDTNRLTPLASAPEGVASVRGLIRTLFPIGDAQADVLVPDTPESRLLRFLPAPPTLARGHDVLTN